MAQLDAIALAHAVKSRLVDFVADDNYVRDPELARLCRALWEGAPEAGGLLGELWVESAFPAKSSKETLATLVASGCFDERLARHLAARGVFPADRLLFTHQLAAIIQSQKAMAAGMRPSLIITAATGAGKTESFLLPILNDLARTPKRPSEGIRCLILYPMNALVNDQVDRLDDWLRDQTEISLFNFTSETPENHRQAALEGLAPEKFSPSRMRTRQEARGLETHAGKAIDPEKGPRGGVPDILITNYSMLEYMLCRPQDAIFFGPGLRAVVVDEAHMYTGTLAAEITLLLRRLSDRCGVPPEQLTHIATSATIGSGDPAELADFGSRLFSKSVEAVAAIVGESFTPAIPAPIPPVKAARAEVIGGNWPLGDTIKTDDNGKSELIRDPEACATVAKMLGLIVGEAAIKQALEGHQGSVARLLHGALPQSPVLQLMARQLLDQPRMPLRVLAAAIWGNDGDLAVAATVGILQMGAVARKDPDSYPLLPHRLHILARSSDGLILCLNPACGADSALKMPGLGMLQSGVADKCVACGSAVLAVCRCSECGDWALAGENQGFRLVPTASVGVNSRFFATRPTVGAVSLFIRPGGDITGDPDGTVPLWALEQCPSCGEAPHDTFRPFISAPALPIAIVAESALGALPAYPAAGNRWLPAAGRRLLAFSDSRREAARLGPRLTRQHEVQVVRAALARCLAESPVVDAAVVQDIADEVDRLQVRLADTALTLPQRQRAERTLQDKRQELSASMEGGPLGDWFEQLGRMPVIAQLLDAETAKNHKPETWDYRSWEENLEAIKKRLPHLVGRELARAVRPYASLESLGLAEVTYPGLADLPAPASVLGAMSLIAARVKLTAVWGDYLASICDALRREGVITLGSPEADEAYHFGTVLVGRWCIREGTGYNMVAMAGVQLRQTKRWFTVNVLVACGLSEAEALALAHAVQVATFEQLLAAANGQSLRWLEVADKPVNGVPHPALRIVFPELCLRQPAQLYRCRQMGTVWPRSVQGLAPIKGTVELEAVAPADLDFDPRYGRQRRELQGQPLFQIGLWAEEHSAQLDPRENRRLQNLFKRGVRNVLSATTTLEVGIDIGGLNAVLIANVPPGKASYLQRAGRAGRRADGSSAVITFTRPRPYDRAVFLRFGAFLEKKLRPPKVFLDRQRIVRRHGNACLLGEFFRQVYAPGRRVGAINAFGSTGVFCGVPLPHYWEAKTPKPALPHVPMADDRLAQQPWFNGARQETGLGWHFLDFLVWCAKDGEATLKPRVRRLFAGTALEFECENWGDYIASVADEFGQATGRWHGEYLELIAAWEGVATDASPAMANAIRYQLKTLAETTVIETLADQQFLPRYGFPIDVLKLSVIIPSETDDKQKRKFREEGSIRLERKGIQALQEYVPGSRLLVGGRMITSRGILKSWGAGGGPGSNSLGLRGQYARCVNGHFCFSVARDLDECPTCLAALSGIRYFLMPRHGFTTAVWDPPTFGTEVEKVGTVERQTISFAGRYAQEATLVVPDLGGVQYLTAQYRESGEIFVYNQGENGCGFALCLRCGFATSETVFGQGMIGLSPEFRNHAPITEKDGWKNCIHPDYSPELLRNQTLAARETTDVLLLDFSRFLPYEDSRRPLCNTLGRAFQIAGAALLELDVRELGFLAVPAGDGGRGLGVALYDNVPGGAGHVRELMELGRRWLEEARQVLYVDAEHNERCDRMCLDCVLMFDTLEAPDTAYQRRDAIAVLDHAMMHGSLPLELTTTREVDQAALQVGGQLDDERLRRARARARKH
ncbi:MAG: box helicase [Spartobacteria bacterium]|nr:box helicase [Spartobacteria bacterium]